MCSALHPVVASAGDTGVPLFLCPDVVGIEVVPAQVEGVSVPKAGEHLGVGDAKDQAGGAFNADLAVQLAAKPDASAVEVPVWGGSALDQTMPILGQDFGLQLRTGEGDAVDGGAVPIPVHVGGADHFSLHWGMVVE
jgi:hypothetical protein